MADEPSPRSTPAPQADAIAAPPPTTQPVNEQVLPDRSQPGSTAPAFVPPWRRPTIAPDGKGDAARRPSVQFVPHATKESNSRSSSAKPPTTRTINLDGTKPSNGNRRLSSPPPPAQFRPSVSFDTFRNPSASDFSLTLNRKHRDYEYTKRSRTFLCGTDTNDYSDTALEWLIDELVDDGDEVVCLRVVEPDSNEARKWSRGQGEKGYRQEAEKFLEAIEKKNTEDRAISLVLEFSIGKVHDTIQQMIRIYEPAILVVGTRGRSLTGYQGLLSSGSVSKYCLQYSPVPVIVVRPSSKREAKKRKRLQDPARTGYRDILDKSEDAPRGRGGHLLDKQNRMSLMGADYGALSEFDSDDPAEEARRVAEAIGYRQLQGKGAVGGGRSSSLSRLTSNTSADDVDGPKSPERLLKSPELGMLDSPPSSDDEDDDEEDGDPSRLQESIRPEDEALMLAYERAQKTAEEEEEERVQREQREQDRQRSASRGRNTGGRSRSAAQEEGGGAAVLGLLAQLDRGIIK